MAYVHFEQATADGTVKTVAALNPPATATHAEIQASENNIFYTCDGTAPTTGATGAGMLLATTHEPKTLLIEDLKAIKFTRAAGADGKLNVHYFGGREI